MELTRDGIEKLKTYYRRTPAAVHPCDPSDKTKCCALSPYSIVENIKWVFKMLVLPGLITGAIIALLILELYNNLVTQILTSVFTTIATFLLYFYSREKILENYHQIQGNEELPEGLEPELNKIGDPILSIGFVGDVMMMRDQKLKFDPLVEKFFKGVPLIVGNLEGIIPEQKNTFAKQSHKNEILDQLVDLLKYDNKWLLCVSNNHSVDFGNNKFFTSTQTIQKHTKPANLINFDVFGRYDVPKVFIDDKICISTGTKWSNQKCWDCTSDFEKIDNYYCSDDRIKFNILYPHWGYENEPYTRRKIQKEAEKLLKKKWDLIFGHHPHTRQPVMIVKEELKKPDGTPLLNINNDQIVLKKLVAFSGGNFTSGVKFFRKKKHIHGIILKCKIGRLKESVNHYAVGMVEWKKTVNKRDGDTKTVMIGQGIADRTRIYILLIGIAAFVIALIPRILELFP